MMASQGRLVYRTSDQDLKNISRSHLDTLHQLNPILNMKNGEDVMATLGSYFPNLSKIGQSEAETAGVALCVTHEQWAGVSVLHKMLPDKDKLGVGVQSGLRTCVLEAIRTMIFKMLCKHSSSDVLAHLVKELQEDVAVHGEVPIKDIKSFYTLEQQGSTRMRCNLCQKVQRNIWEGKIHLLNNHFNWKVQCSKKGCNTMVSVRASGQPFPHSDDHSEDK